MEHKDEIKVEKDYRRRVQSVSTRLETICSRRKMCINRRCWESGRKSERQCLDGLWADQKRCVLGRLLDMDVYIEVKKCLTIFGEARVIVVRGCRSTGEWRVWGVCWKRVSWIDWKRTGRPLRHVSNIWSIEGWWSWVMKCTSEVRRIWETIVNYEVIK